MAKKKSVWKGTKFKDRMYVGAYSRLTKNEGDMKKGDRVFTLTAVLKNGKEHVIAFESHEAAKADGWKIVK